MTSEKTPGEDSLAINNSISVEEETTIRTHIRIGPVLFSLGEIVATPGAIVAIERDGSGIGVRGLLDRHSSGDWGDLSKADKRENDLSVTDGFRIFSAYVLPNTGEKIWVITEADRSSTTLILPKEY